MGLEEGWYRFLDWLDDHGIHLYPMVEWLESRGIPSFPTIPLVFLILVVLIVWLVWPKAVAVNVTVLDENNNPVANAYVSFKDARGNLISKIVKTNEKGFAKLRVKKRRDANLVVDAPPGELRDKIEAANTVEIRNYSVRLTKESRLFTLNFRTEGGSLITEEVLDITYSCLDGTSSGDLDIVSGSANIDVDCSRLSLTIFGGREFILEGTRASSIVVDVEGTEKDIVVTETVGFEPGTGEIRAVVKHNNIGVMNLRVELYDSFSELEVDSGFTAEDGSVVFSNLRPGAYYINIPAQAGFAHYDGSLDEILVEENRRKDVVVNIQRAADVLGRIFFRFSDQEGAELSNMLVSIRKSGDVNPLFEDTVQNGVLEFPVTEEGIYVLNIEPQAEVPAWTEQFEVRRSSACEIEERPGDVKLVKVLGGCSVNYDIIVNLSDISTLHVVILDPFGIPASGARVVVFEGRNIVDETFADNDGIAEIALPVGRYFYVKAFTESAFGESMEILLQRDVSLNNIVVNLVEITAFVTVNVQSSDGILLNGADVLFKNPMGFVKLSGITENGRFSGQVPIGTPLFLEIRRVGYGGYHSLPFILNKDEEAEFNITLYRIEDLPKIKVEFVGMYSMQGNLVGEDLADDRTYEARFRVKTREIADLLGLHIRVGDKDNVEEEIAFIEKIEGFGVARYGTQFTGEDEEEDSSSLTNAGSEAKWAEKRVAPQENVVSNPGVYDFKVRIRTREDVEGSFNLKYRAWIERDEDIYKDPADEEEESIFYSKTHEETYNVGEADSIAKGGIVFKVNLFDGFVAKPGTTFDIKKAREYSLQLEIENNEKDLANAALVVEKDSDAISLEGLSVVEDRVAFNIGEFKEGETKSQSINIKGIKTGTTNLKITLTEDNKKIAEIFVFFSILEMRERPVDIFVEPQTLLPKTQALIRVLLHDSELEKGVEDAIVKIFKENEFGLKELVGEFADAGDGFYVFTLAGSLVEPGSLFVIEAEKPGYEKAEYSLDVLDSVLSVVPQEIRQTIDVREDKGLLFEISLSNLTERELTLERIFVDGEAKKYVGVVWENDSERILPPLGTKQIILSLKPTTEAKDIVEPIDLLFGTINFEASDKEENKFRESLDLRMNLSLGAGVDALECFNIDALKREWNIFVGEDYGKQEFGFNLINRCTVNNNRVSLQNVVVRQRWLGDGTGEFSIRNKSENTIGKEPVILFERFNFNEEGEDFTLSYKPDRKTVEGELKAEIILQATLQTDDGIQKLSVVIPVDVIYSNLVECIKLTPEEEVITDTDSYGEVLIENTCEKDIKLEASGKGVRLTTNENVISDFYHPRNEFGITPGSFSGFSGGLGSPGYPGNMFGFNPIYNFQNPFYNSFDAYTGYGPSYNPIDNYYSGQYPGFSENINPYYANMPHYGSGFGPRESRGEGKINISLRAGETESLFMSADLPGEYLISYKAFRDKKAVEIGETDLLVKPSALSRLGECIEVSPLSYVVTSLTRADGRVTNHCLESGLRLERLDFRPILSDFGYRLVVKGRPQILYQEEIRKEVQDYSIIKMPFAQKSLTAALEILEDPKKLEEAIENDRIRQEMMMFGAGGLPSQGFGTPFYSQNLLMLNMVYGRDKDTSKEGLLRSLSEFSFYGGYGIYNDPLIGCLAISKSQERKLCLIYNIIHGRPNLLIIGLRYRESFIAPLELPVNIIDIELIKDVIKATKGRAAITPTKAKFEPGKYPGMFGEGKKPGAREKEIAKKKTEEERRKELEEREIEKKAREYNRFFDNADCKILYNGKFYYSPDGNATDNLEFEVVEEENLERLLRVDIDEITEEEKKLVPELRAKLINTFGTTVNNITLNIYIPAFLGEGNEPDIDENISAQINERIDREIKKTEDPDVNAALKIWKEKTNAIKKYLVFNGLSCDYRAFERNEDYGYTGAAAYKVYQEDKIKEVSCGERNLYYIYSFGKPTMEKINVIEGDEKIDLTTEKKAKLAIIDGKINVIRPLRNVVFLTITATKNLSGIDQGVLSVRNFFNSNKRDLWYLVAMAQEIGKEPKTHILVNTEEKQSYFIDVEARIPESQVFKREEYVYDLRFTNLKEGESVVIALINPDLSPDLNKTIENYYLGETQNLSVKFDNVDTSPAIPEIFTKKTVEIEKGKRINIKDYRLCFGFTKTSGFFYYSPAEVLREVTKNAKILERETAKETKE